MHLLSAEALPRTHSPVHRLPASVKVGAALLVLVGIAALPLGAPRLLLIPFAFVAAALAMARLSLRFILRRLLVLEPFALAASVLALLRPDGVLAFWTLLGKSTLSLTVVVLLSATTPFGDLFDVLRRLRLPRLLLTTMALLSRYLFVLADQTERMKRARAARNFTGGKRRTWMLNSAAIGALVVRSVERAERVYAAMRARGWQ